IVYRGNGLPPNQDWKKTGSGDTFLRKPPLPAPTAADAFLPSGARIPRLYRPGEPMQGIPRFAIPISPDHIAFPFGTMYGLRMRPNTVRLEDGIISRMRLGDPRQIATGPIQIQPGGILTGQWGQSKVIVQSAGACLSLKQDSIHTIISPDETNSNAFSIGLAPSPMFGTYRGGVSQIRAARIAGAIASMPNPETETRVSVIELGQKTGKAAIFGLGDFGAVINESPAKQIGGHAAGHPSSKVFIGTDATGNYGFPTAAAMWESDVSISKQQILVIATHDVLRAFNGGSDFSRLLPKGTVLNTTTNMAQTIVEEARRKTTGGRLAATLIQIGSSR
ncbi:hypothetical protein EBR96_06185, partial [bacterium]|nr:hypothetical protein [bacterium]